MVSNNTVNELVDALSVPQQSSNNVYNAVVANVDNEGVAWVHVEGSSKLTPTASKSTEVSQGDHVSVEWRNNKLYIAGNYSSPSAGVVRVANVEQTANNAQATADVAFVAANNAVADAERAATAATSAETYASQAATSASNAATSASNAATSASNAESSASTAATAATNAQASSATAATAAQNAESSASQAATSASSASASASQAATDAASAKASAHNANEYAARALGNLSTVQSVAETLTWITSHGTMALTTDTALDPTHVYFVRDNNGDYQVGSYRYSIVIEPDVADIATYYELSIDESLNNYVGTHLALTSEGLWLLPAGSNAYRILIATGAGTTYTNAGVYIIDDTGGTVGYYGGTGLEVFHGLTEIAHLGYGSGTNQEGGTSTAPYYTLGRRASGSAVGNYSVAEGNNTIASGFASHAEGSSGKVNGVDYYCQATGKYSHAEGYGSTASNFSSHAEGWTTTASGDSSHAEGHETIASGTITHAEGYRTTASGYQSHAEGLASLASGNASHAEGSDTEASGTYSHAQNSGTIAASSNQTALGRYNISDSSGTYAVIVGNGQSSARSNALTVAWNGNVVASGTITDGSGNVLSAIPTNVSAFTNDAGYISSETDPTVPSWAKAATKPSYSASEISGLLDFFYPVGSYYETSDSTFDPNTSWGGTWVQETEGLVHIGAGSNYTLGSTGGNKNAIIPYHNHGVQETGEYFVTNENSAANNTRVTYSSSGNRMVDGFNSTESSFHHRTNTGYAGTVGNEVDANMQPYVVVNRWHRTA